MVTQLHNAPMILRRKQVEGRTGLSRSTLYQRIAEGTFPAQISLGSRSVGWVESEVTGWVENQIVKSRKPA